MSHEKVMRQLFPIELGGDFDDDLMRWAQRAVEYGMPLIAEYGTECNGYWFPWNAAHNGMDEAGQAR